MVPNSSGGAPKWQRTNAAHAESAKTLFLHSGPAMINPVKEPAAAAGIGYGTCGWSKVILPTNDPRVVMR